MRVIAWTQPATEPFGSVALTWVTCLGCLGKNFHNEMRDNHWERGKPPPDRHSYGAWRVCDDCGHEWPIEALSLWDAA